MSNCFIKNAPKVWKKTPPKLRVSILYLEPGMMAKPLHFPIIQFFSKNNYSTCSCRIWKDYSKQDAKRTWKMQNRIKKNLLFTLMRKPLYHYYRVYDNLIVSLFLVMYEVLSDTIVQYFFLQPLVIFPYLVFVRQHKIVFCFLFRLRSDINWLQPELYLLLKGQIWRQWFCWNTPYQSYRKNFYILKAQIQQQIRECARHKTKIAEVSPKKPFKPYGSRGNDFFYEDSESHVKDTFGNFQIKLKVAKW